MPKPQVFTDDDMATMRGALDEMRPRGPYEPGKWFVAPANRDPKVVGRFPDRVIIRDITLRTMEQMVGVIVTPEERRELLVELVSAGVPSIQTSIFRRGHSIDEMKAEIALVHSINPRCEVVFGGGSTDDDIALAASAGFDAVSVWSAFLGKAAPSCAGAVYHRAWTGREWRDLRFPQKPSDQIDRSVRLIGVGKQHGIKVGGAINLLPYASEEYVHEYCRRVAEAGAYEVVLADGPSGTGPEAYGYIVGLCKEAAPRLPVGVHTHNMFDLGTACAISALRAGAEVVEVAVNEYELSSGQADLAAVVTALRVLYGVDTGIDLSRLTPIARLAEKITGYETAWNHPVTGRGIFDHAGADEYVQEIHVDPLIHACMTPELVGNTGRHTISSVTGPFNMWDKLEELGFAVERAQVEAVLAAVKARMAQRKGPIIDDEIRVVARSVLASRAPATA